MKIIYHNSRLVTLEIYFSFPVPFVLSHLINPLSRDQKERRSDLWREAIQKGQLKVGQYDIYNDKSFGTTEFSAEEISKLVFEDLHLIHSPILNPRRYLRLIRKFFKQKNPIGSRNFVRLPLLIKYFNKLRYNHLEKKRILKIANMTICEIP